MIFEKTDEGHTKYTYDSEIEYQEHGKSLWRTVGRRNMLYEGWLNDKLIRITRR